MPTIFGASTASGIQYKNPVIGIVGQTHHVKIDLSGLTTDEVDQYGQLKPGVIPRLAGGLGVLISGASQVADGITIEAQQLDLATIPPTNTTLAGETRDHFVTVATHCHVNRDIIEDDLGRALSANEVAALAGAMITISST